MTQTHNLNLPSTGQENNSSTEKKKEQKEKKKKKKELSFSPRFLKSFLTV